MRITPLQIILLSLSSFGVYAQEQDLPATTQEAAGAYLEGRTTSLEQYLGRSQKIRQRLLKRLKRKEARLARKLAAKDSALYAQYLAMPVTYDSIATLSEDSATLRQLPRRRDPLIDSLKNIQSFAQQQAAKLGAASGLAGKAGIGDYTGKLGELQQQLNAEQQVKSLVQQRTQALEGLAGKANISGLKNIQKDVYYAGEKIKAWKEVANDPDEAEAKALEYLQGTEGFSEYLNPNKGAWGGLGSNATAADLERMGFQTKRLTSEALQQTFGNNLSGLQQGMAEQVQQFQEKYNDISGKVNEVKGKVQEGKQSIAQAREQAQQLKNTEKPAFRKNPERGKPFWQRIEWQYNFQTTRPTPEGRPAMLELGAGAGFKHTPRLSYGIGIGLSTGLGSSWEQIRISYEGLSARAYADWQWQYGISIQAGYERAWRPQNRAWLYENQDRPKPTDPASGLKEAFGAAQDAAYIGLMKRYRINSSWSGTFLLGYNFLWQQSGTRSPLMVRIGWSK